MRTRTLALLTLLAVGPLALLAGPPGRAADGGRAARVSAVSWVAGATALDVGLTGGRPATVRVDVTGGTVDTVPSGCAASTVVTVRSHVSADGRTLVCAVSGRRAGTLRVEVRPDASAGSLGARVEQGGGAVEAPPLALGPGRTDSPRTLRLLSSPDFLNADVADLGRGRLRGTNRAYERALDRVLGDWSAADPDAVLVAGDLVNGRWDRDDRRVRRFGPVGTRAQKVAAVRRAARTYYPAWSARFRQHGLSVFPAVGDHEYGDDPWPAARRGLAPVYAREFARAFTRDLAAPGLSRPRGPHAGTAYAWRPAPDVQVVSIDPFDLTSGKARLRLDAAQQRWLERVLARAQADGVRWTVVQGHLPVLEPVRARGSSELRYEGGARSRLWRAFERYGVDLYLCGEVHDVTASQRGGVVQLAHGGAFQYGLTTYALLDVHPDRIDVSLEDHDVRVGFHGPRLWETARSGLPASVDVRRGPFTLGTLSLDGAGGVSRRSGVLLPYRG